MQKFILSFYKVSLPLNLKQIYYLKSSTLSLGAMCFRDFYVEALNANKKTSRIFKNVKNGIFRPFVKF